MADIQIYADRDHLVRAVAETIVLAAESAVVGRERFSIGLSGGSTVIALFDLLASAEFANRIKWPRVDVFWGDERCVPPDHPASNYRLAHDRWLSQVPIPPEQVHRMRGELDPAQAASQYEAVLRDYFGEVSVPQFDLLLQGMGEDGHTASLFPHSAALRKVRRWVTENFVEKLEQPWRLTLTLPVINAAREVVFMVSGASKAATLREVLEGPYRPDESPAQMIKPDHGRLVWMVDGAAAAQLTTR